MQIKKETGLVGIDISIAVIIIVLFVTIITTIFYQIGMSQTRINRNAVATDLAVNILEKIAIMPYDEFIRTDFNDVWFNGKVIIPKEYKVEIRKLEQHEEKEDYVKEVKVSITYKVGNDEKNVSIKTLKKRED